MPMRAVDAFNGGMEVHCTSTRTLSGNSEARGKGVVSKASAMFCVQSAPAPAAPMLGLEASRPYAHLLLEASSCLVQRERHPAHFKTLPFSPSGEPVMICPCFSSQFSLSSSSSPPIDARARAPTTGRASGPGAPGSKQLWGRRRETGGREEDRRQKRGRNQKTEHEHESLKVKGQQPKQAAVAAEEGKLPFYNQK